MVILKSSVNRPLMVLGTSSGVGKTLMVAAICRVLFRRGFCPVPFKGQNMSNNAWVDSDGGEMAYSQAMQAWASGIPPHFCMNPILLKPKGDCTSEVIHLGKSIGMTKAKDYYEKWFGSGWQSIREGLNILESKYHSGRIILEGAGSPVEVNLRHRDLTNLRLAQYLKANCILVADIERGGVFAQIIGTLILLTPSERKLIKGVLINKFRGAIELFDEGKRWLEKETGIPVLGIMPWLNDLFPPEDSLDLLERSNNKAEAEIQIAVLRLPSISNFSDLDPLDSEPTVKLNWIYPGQSLGNPDAVIIPGSKQTIKDLKVLFTSGLASQIIQYSKDRGNVFGICGGFQMMGHTLFDPSFLESNQGSSSENIFTGLKLLPIHTTFLEEKVLNQRNLKAIWPESHFLYGFELHHGISHPLKGKERLVSPITEDPLLGLVGDNDLLKNLAGTYIHGIFENGSWRRSWLNMLRTKKDLALLPLEVENHTTRLNKLIDKLADVFEKNIDLNPIINS